MAQLSQRIEITDRHRPCWYRGASGLYKAIFHRWVEERKLVDASPLQGGHPGGCIAATFALIETEDGKMWMVVPDSIQFIDHAEFHEYAWEER